MTADLKHRMDCECGDPVHFVQVEAYKWGDNTDDPRHFDINVCFVGNRNFGFWKRLWCGLRFAFNVQEMIVSDMVISKQSARETGEFLIHVADQADEWEGKAND